jgi:diguanylate cyclase (GGDEF)-like protein/PAS domain S-box-containing protein
MFEIIIPLLHLFVAAAAWWVSTHASLDHKARRAWRLFSSAFLCLLAVDALQLSLTGDAHLALWAGALSTLFYMILLAGLLSFTSILGSREERERFWLDTGIVMISGGVVIWYFVVRSVSWETSDGTIAAALTLIRPVGDLVILFGCATVLLGSPSGGAKKTFGLLTLGLLTIFAADLGYGSSLLGGDYRAGYWVQWLWTLSGLLTLAGCLHQRFALSRGDADQQALARHGSLSLLPYLATALSYGLLVFAAYRQWVDPLGGLIIGAVALTGVVIARQISAVRAHDRAQAAVARSEARFRSLVQNSSDVVMILSPDMRVLYHTPSASRLLGRPQSEIDGARLTEFLSPEDRTLALAFFTDLLKQPNSSAAADWRLVAAGGTERHVENVCSNLLSDSAVNGLVLNTRDVTERKAAEEKLQHDAFHDSLTGLPNRSLFKEHLRIAIGRARRSPDHRYAVLFLDLDRFKIVNDSLGHSFGDELLKVIADRLAQTVRANIDIVARLGGDEFVILLEGIEEASTATHVASRIQHSLREPVRIGGHEVFVTASIGVALSTTGYADAEDLLRDADTAMYRAKARGRACHEVFDKQMHARAVALLELENDLRRAVEREEFEVYYQPIVSISEGKRITGFEALVRWRHPTKGLIPPGDFISVAEDTGQIIAIGRWVLREACRQMKRWDRRGQRAGALTLSVNLSGKQFLQPDLVEQVRETLRETGFDPRRLQLEITESVVIENTEVVTSMLTQLREMGVQVTMDDFGTGYSSLSYLHSFPIDVLKIDRSFIAGMSGRDSKSEIVKSVLTLASSMGMKVVAEGVETEEQLSHLQGLNCSYGQGYLFSRPVDADAVEHLLFRHESLNELPVLPVGVI